MLLYLNHEVMDVDQFSTDWEGLEGLLTQHFLEAMVVLYELCQCTLYGVCVCVCTIEIRASNRPTKGSPPK